MLLSPAGCVAEPRRHGVNATKRPRIAHAHACERARAHAHMHSRSRACIKHAGMQARHSASAPLAPWPCAGTAPPTAKHATTPAHENAASARRPCRSLPRPRRAMLKARALRPLPPPPALPACPFYPVCAAYLTAERPARPLGRLHYGGAVWRTRRPWLFFVFWICCVSQIITIRAHMGTQARRALGSECALVRG